MDRIPERPAVAGFHRRALGFGERFVPIPDINPSWWGVFGLVGSVIYLYLTDPAARFAMLFFVWVTDWYDGATARRYGKISREGYLIDDVVDRFSEGFVFLGDVSSSAVARWFFVLWIVNCALTLWSVHTGKHRILPLRFAYLFVLAWWVLT